ncbi:MAG: tRNA (adenosine(37)-N6)-threonylcarbamoyltransferase complex ATPase subunit type 1 TsaE [Christensenellales bacterium]|jgi:tRNA threonylcarbamoyladenosine biosynthesis protein TsaE
MRTVSCGSPEDTLKLGEVLGGRAQAGCFIALWGDLGCGKTVFARGVARALGIDNVTSPTYTIMNLYEGRLPFYHFDAYRLQDEDELYALGGEEYFYGDGVCVVEWPQRVREALPKDRLDVFFQREGEDGRRLSFCPGSPRYERMLEGIGG